MSLLLTQSGHRLRPPTVWNRQRPAFSSEAAGAKSAGLTTHPSSRLLSAADGPRHDINAAGAELGEVRLQAGLDPAATGLDAAAHRCDVAAALVGERRNPDQGYLAWPRQIRQMRVKAGPDCASTRRHISARRPDVGGTFPHDLTLLRHRGCCRKQSNSTDCKNDLLHRLSPIVVTGLWKSQGPPAVLGALYPDRTIRTATIACTGCHTRNRAAGSDRCCTVVDRRTHRSPTSGCQTNPCWPADTSRSHTGMDCCTRRTGHIRADTRGGPAADERLQRWLR